MTRLHHILSFCPLSTVHLAAVVSFRELKTMASNRLNVRSRLRLMEINEHPLGYWLGHWTIIESCPRNNDVGYPASLTPTKVQSAMLTVETHGRCSSKEGFREIRRDIAFRSRLSVAPNDRSYSCPRYRLEHTRISNQLPALR